MEFKLTINNNNKSYKHVIKEPETNAFIGLKIGESIDGSKFGFDGYEFMINGGSDATGIPMHKGVIGSEKTRMLRRQKGGQALRKSIMGNTISETISQINLIITKKGKKAIDSYFKVAEEKKE